MRKYLLGGHMILTEEGDKVILIIAVIGFVALFIKVGIKVYKNTRK